MHQWHYTAKKKDQGQANQSSLVCEVGDTTCYFLPYHGCGPVDKLKNDSSIKLLQDVEDKGGGDVSAILDDVGWSAYLFVTRKQLWICRVVFDYKEIFKQESNWFTTCSFSPMILVPLKKHMNSFRVSSGNILTDLVIMASVVGLKIKLHHETQPLKLLFFCSFLIWCRIVLVRTPPPPVRRYHKIAASGRDP